VKKILKGYTSLVREMLNLPNDASFLSLPAGLWVLIVFCGIIGLVRNAISVIFKAPGFYSFEPDILWTMLTFPVNLFLFPGALLYWQLQLLGYRDLNVNSIFGLSFHLQMIHLIVPFIDLIGFGLGMPPYYVIGSRAIATEWYTNLLYMTPGIIIGWWVTAYTVARVFKRRLGIGWFAILFTSLTTFVVILIPTYIIFPALNTIFSRMFGPWLWSPLKYLAMTPKWFPFWGNGTYFALTALFGVAYYLRQQRHEKTKST
jgi:hypothetical protein